MSGISDLRSSMSNLSVRDRMNLWKTRESNKTVASASGASVLKKATIAATVPTPSTEANISKQTKIDEAIQPSARADDDTLLVQSVKPPTVDEITLFSKIWENVATHTQAENPVTVPVLSESDISTIQRVWSNYGEIPNAESISEVGRKHWREIRLFVSSTFTDYFAEREILVKQVIPQLREWCEARRMTLVDIDLRWGVPAESTTETILRACLSEIDRARVVNRNPFFLNMLGQRYGWVPGPADVPDSVASQYNWVPNASVTHMEILCGAFRDLNPNALFFLRDDSLVPQIPSSFIPQFVEPRWTSGVALQALRAKVRERFGPTNQVIDYSVAVKGVESSAAGIPKVVFGGLEEFGDEIYKRLTALIEAQYPFNSEELTLSEQLSIPHDYFLKANTEVVLGRDELIMQLLDTVKTAALSPSMPILVKGSEGVGKSAVMATLAVEAMQSGLKTIFYSTQASSTIDEEFDVQTIRDPIHQLLMLELGDEAQVAKATETKESFLATEMFTTSAFNGSFSPDIPALIIIDGFNVSGRNLKEGIVQEYLGITLPLPPGVVLIMSSKDPEGIIEADLKKIGIYENIIERTVIELPQLDIETRRNVIEHKLGLFNKRLHHTQMDLMLANPGNTILEWLNFACEELRVFGAFETVTERIRTLPETVLGLLNEQLTRNLVTAGTYSDGSTATMIKDCLIFLLASDQDGLSEKELMALLAKPPTEEGTESTQLLYSEWSIVRLFIASFVRQIARANGSSNIVLRSYPIQNIIEKHFDVDKHVLLPYNQRLCNFFRTQSGLRLSVSYPNQLIKCDDVQGIKAFFTNSAFQRTPDMIKRNLASTVRCTTTLIMNGPMKPRPERICMGCAMKINDGKNRAQSCIVCSSRVFTMQMQPGSTPKLWMGESESLKCQRHSPFAAMPNGIMKCAVCKNIPVDAKMSYLAIKCRTCTGFNENMMGRCCELR